MLEIPVPCTWYQPLRSILVKRYVVKFVRERKVSVVVGLSRSPKEKRRGSRKVRCNFCARRIATGRFGSVSGLSRTHWSIPARVIKPARALYSSNPHASYIILKRNRRFSEMAAPIAPLVPLLHRKIPMNFPDLWKHFRPICWPRSKSIGRRNGKERQANRPYCGDVKVAESKVDERNTPFENSLRPGALRLQLLLREKCTPVIDSIRTREICPRISSWLVNTEETGQRETRNSQSLDSIVQTGWLINFRS